MTTTQTKPRITPGKAIVARQPICDRDQRTFGYELLFRKPGDTTAVIGNPDHATEQVVFDSLMEIGLDRMAGQSTAFINVTRDFIFGDHCRSLPKERVVLEILEDIKPDEELLEALGALKGEGFQFALDDYSFEEHLKPLVPFCNYIKVDARLTNPEGVMQHLDALKEYPAKLLAEKVETAQEFDFYLQSGFDYFQGFFFCKPKTFSRPRLSRNRASICRLLAKLHQPEIEIREIETIVSEDLSLSYQLLRYINSASFALRNKIESIGHAVRLVGTEHIKTLASLMTLASIEDKPLELFTTSLVRARMCELMAKQQRYKNPGAYFTVGLLSCLDAFLDCRMDEALELLPLSTEICNALLKQEGKLGTVLKLVRSYETGKWNEIEEAEGDFAPMGDAYLDAVDFGENLVQQMNTISGPKASARLV